MASLCLVPLCHIVASASVGGSVGCWTHLLFTYTLPPSQKPKRNYTLRLTDPLSITVVNLSPQKMVSPPLFPCIFLLNHKPNPPHQPPVLTRRPSSPTRTPGRRLQLQHILHNNRHTRTRPHRPSSSRISQRHHVRQRPRYTQILCPSDNSSRWCKFYCVRRVWTGAEFAVDQGSCADGWEFDGFVGWEWEC